MIADWEAFARESASGEEVDLATIQPGDTLRITTGHTEYYFVMIDQQEARLSCSRSDRPAGRVRISGCCFMLATTFKPRRLFCGGRLEFTFLRENQPTRFRTSSIQAIVHGHDGYPVRELAA